jgi:hypothetical protein
MVISSCVFAHAFRTEVILQEAGEARPCFAKYLIEKQAEHELTDDEMAYLAGSMFGAGSDTVRLGLTLALSGLAAPLMHLLFSECVGYKHRCNGRSSPSGGAETCARPD